MYTFDPGYLTAYLDEELIGLRLIIAEINAIQFANINNFSNLGPSMLYHQYTTPTLQTACHVAYKQIYYRLTLIATGFFDLRHALPLDRHIF